VDWRDDLIDFLRRCPLLLPALAATAGVFIGSAAPALPWVWLAVGLGLAGTGLWWSRPAGQSTLLASVLVVFIARLQVDQFQFSNDDLTHFASDTPRLCRVRLELPYEPAIRSGTFGHSRALPPTQYTLADVSEVLTRAGWRPAAGGVLLSIAEPVAALHAGQSIEVLGFVERPGLAMNPGQFDWQRYYRGKRVLGSVRVRHANNVQILSEASPSLLQSWRSATRRWLDAGFPESRELDRALIGALVLGDYDMQLRDVRDDFQRTGTSHHLAVSGMHVALVAAMAFFVLSLCRARPWLCWTILAFVVVAYGLAVAPSPPAWRSVLMCSGGILAMCLRRRVHPIQLLSGVLIIMLMIHPGDVFSSGFQLSFAIVAGMILLTNRLMEVLTPDRQIVLAHELETMPAAERCALWVDRTGRRILCGGLIAWLVSMPLVAFHFDRLNPWQVPASLMLGPIVALSLATGVAKLAVSAVNPFDSIDKMMSVPAAAASRWMRSTVDHLAELPLADVPLSAPSPWLVWGCWITLVMGLMRWKLPLLRWTFRLSSAALLMLILCGPEALRSGRYDGVRVTLMSVGAGQCALVETPGGRNVLIDAGSSSLSDLNLNVIAPVLRERRISRIDTIFISHANTDHYSGVGELVSMYDVREVLVGPTFVDDAVVVQTGVALLDVLRDKDRPPRTIRAGDVIPLARDCAIEVLGDTSTKPAMANDRSTVLRLSFGRTRMLFTGDIQEEGIRGLMNAEDDLRADVLVAPHHGSTEDSTAELIRRVDPEWILSSNDRTPSGKQTALQSIADGRQLLRTHTSGAVIVWLEEGKVDCEPFIKR
jgi:competence protein ComEC